MAERLTVDRLAGKVEVQFAELRRDVSNLGGELERADLVKVLERLAVLEDRVAELKRVREETERRHWQFVYIFAGAMASLLVTVVVQLVLAQVKK